MKRTLFSCIIITIYISLSTSTTVYSQKITKNPRVYSDSSDEVSMMRITSVITDNEFTFVTFSYATTLFESWFMINTKTYLNTNRSKSDLKILDWGIVTKDDDKPLASLNLNQQYIIKRRISYDFYMAFPAIPKGSTLLDIVVPAQHLEGERGGFFWRGIQINNETTEDLSKNKQNHQPKRGFTPSGSGSGFAISDDGYVATCYHVIADAKEIRIRGLNGNFKNTMNARVHAVDKKNDLAILKINNIHLAQIPYSFTSVLSDVGENIFVLGYPQTQHLGEELKLTTGVISSRSGYRGDMTTYQISAQALPGNSGGPLFDNEGRLIGVVSAKYIEPNVSYAVKFSYLNSLIENAKIRFNNHKNQSIADKPLVDKVKSIRDFIYIIEVEK